MCQVSYLPSHDGCCFSVLATDPMQECQLRWHRCGMLHTPVVTWQLAASLYRKLQQQVLSDTLRKFWSNLESETVCLSLSLMWRSPVHQQHHRQVPVRAEFSYSKLYVTSKNIPNCYSPWSMYKQQIKPAHRSNLKINTRPKSYSKYLQKTKFYKKVWNKILRWFSWYRQSSTAEGGESSQN